MSTPPKAQAVRRLAGQALAPVLADLGFSRPRGVGLGGWVRPQDGRWLVIWVQLWRHNASDNLEGSRFTVELQLADEPVAGGSGPRARLWKLLSDEERMDHLDLYNQVIRKARPNPTLLARLRPRRRPAHVADLELRDAPFDVDDDVWFRYADEEDARRWLDFVARALPAAIDRLLA